MTTARHYSEADLLETYYTEPGASMPVMMHLAGCSDCAARYERLARKLRGLSSCHSEKPEAFWSDQRSSIARRIGSAGHGRRSYAKLAAAAVFTLAVGGLATWNQFRPSPAPEQPRVAAAAQSEIAADESLVAADPWQSEQLRDFQDVVEWESWVDPSTPEEGKSL